MGLKEPYRKKKSNPSGGMLISIKDQGSRTKSPTVLGAYARSVSHDTVARDN